MTHTELLNLRIKADYHGNLYVLVPIEGTADDPTCYYTVYLSVVEEPCESENCEERYFRNM